MEKSHHVGVQGDSSFYGDDLNKWKKATMLVYKLGDSSFYGDDLNKATMLVYKEIAASMVMILTNGKR